MNEPSTGVSDNITHYERGTSASSTPKRLARLNEHKRPNKDKVDNVNLKDASDNVRSGFGNSAPSGVWCEVERAETRSFDNIKRESEKDKDDNISFKEYGNSASD